MVLLIDVGVCLVTGRMAIPKDLYGSVFLTIKGVSKDNPQYHFVGSLLSPDLL